MIYIDQIGNEVHLKEPPKRIISLVPSQTEFLFELGLENEIVGITKFCVHPGDKVKEVSRIGGTKKFLFDKIHSLQPDLIIGNKEENYKEGIEKLYSHYPVWMSDIYDLVGALKMMASLGEITERVDITKLLIHKISNDFNNTSISNQREALYLIWKNPYMSVGGDTFINHMMPYAGFINILGKSKRYPVVSEKEISTLAPEYILLSSEPFPFKSKHIAEIQKLSSKTKILIVDGEMFSWFGSRLQYAASYFKKLQKL
ncbi:MAG: helical backbone metal receptor [Bacteroidota bacterium]|jgi:ABC-type Fe3+-hydroxamate transport system substrate-binding protein|nr:helical backbone metal receptor [Bacteroidota bacterium]